VIWAGGAVALLGEIVATLVDARLFHRDRASRHNAVRAGLTLAVAAITSGIVSTLLRPLASVSALSFREWMLAWQHDLPILVTFLAAHSIAELVIESLARPAKADGRAVSLRLRAGVAVLGYAPLAIVTPAAAVFGLWTFVPLAVALAVLGHLIRRAVEISSLKRQLSVSHAMGLASLADAATAEPTALLYRFLHLAQTLVHAERSIVWMIDSVNDEIIPAVGLPNMGDFAGLRMRVGEGLIGSAAERTRPLIVSDAARTLRRGKNEPAADSWLLYPIISQQKVLGVAHWMRPASMPFTADDALQLEGLVPQVGVAVESLREKSKMRELAATDGLTGLYNHKRICDLLRDEMRRAERYNRPLSVLMVDVDSFKSFSDSYGHQSGDQLLKSVAQLLRSGVRGVDRLGRYGGEEFIIVMPETHKDDAYQLAERIRSKVEENAYIIVAGEEIHRTISVGVASFPEDGLNPTEVVSRADEALYRAKDSGRNCVVWA
jgi:diguanylate cyclase (GGDEF)-like protein